MNKRRHLEEQSTKFLATTALENFWDTSKPILFLGEWCQRYSRRFFWGSLGGEVVCSPWYNRQKLYDAYHYVNDIYERLLPLLAETLNTIHSVKYSIRYWRIVIGPWLYWYILNVYDKYIHLRVALDCYPDLTTIGLSEESFVTPQNTIDFVQYAKGDSYNLQLYTRILMALGKNFPRKSMEVINEPFVGPKKNVFWKVCVNRVVKKIFNAVGQIMQNGRPIILKSSFFSSYVEMQLFLKTGGKVWPYKRNVIELPFFSLNQQVRSNLQGLCLEGDKFVSLLVSMLPFDVPHSFIEGFEVIKNEVENNYPAAPRTIFSANSWYFDEAFKQWAAVSAEVGTMLIGAQHGGNYGSIAYHPSEVHELTITDRFYSWGWDRADCASKVIPLPAPKLIGRKLIGASNQKEGILFVATSASRYSCQFQMSNYPVWQSRFVVSIFEEIRAKMRVRLHHEDLGWDFAQRWTEHYPNVLIENWEVNFLESLQNCRLYVGDHLSTTFVEAMSVDIPTILFWDPEVNLLRPEAKPYYEQLRAVGILYDTPETAAAAANSIYCDVESWWNAPDRQAVRQRFCDQFAWMTHNAINRWADEFKRIANGDVAK